jgi:hypothetical protein
MTLHAPLERLAPFALEPRRRPPGCVHTVVSETGALVLAVTSGPTEPA